MEIFDSAITENNQILSQLVNLLKTGKKVYVFDENNLQKLSKCLVDSINCLELEDKLIELLETNYFEQKSTKHRQKLKQITNNNLNKADQTHNQLSTDPSQKQIKNESKAKEKKLDQLLNNYSTTNSSVKNNRTLTNNNQEEFINLIYLLTDKNVSSNLALERNKSILSKGGHPFEVIICKDMSLYHYQNQIKELIKDAQKKGHNRIMILNGNDLLNNKFTELLKRQVGKINNDCHLWFLGNTKETTAKEILNTDFDLEDYLFLYDDIVNAKLTTLDKAQLHWKTYGHRESRYAKINCVNGLTINVANLYGFVISAEIYDKYIEHFNKQNNRDCKNILTELNNNILDIKTIWHSRPDLIIPQFNNLNNHQKNSQLSVKNGWYYNFYK
jgi:hypothetical protein